MTAIEFGWVTTRCANWMAKAAGFLQYDPNAESSLPAPRVTTALSPGFALRFGIKDTPFSFNPSLLYRPARRAQSSDRTAPAADALQLGLYLYVDVTIFRLAQYGPTPE